MSRKKRNRRKVNLNRMSFKESKNFFFKFTKISDDRGFGNEKKVESAAKKLIGQEKHIENFVVQIQKEGGYFRYSRQDRKQGKDRWIEAYWWPKGEVEETRRVFIEYQIKSSEKWAETHLKKFPDVPVIVIRRNDTESIIAEKIIRMLFLSITTASDYIYIK